MTELKELKGIGTKTAGVLNRLGIFTAEDLVWYYPRDYETFEEPIPLYQLEPGKIGTCEGVLFKPVELIRHNGRIFANAQISDISGRVRLTWFNSPFIKNSIKTGVKYIFRGRVYEKNGIKSMAQPRFYEAENYHEKYLGKMRPIYPLTKGISNNLMIKLISEALNKCLKDTEFLSDDIREKYGLIPAGTALIRLHFPRNKEELKAALDRVVFNEFFLNFLAAENMTRSVRLKESAFKCKPDYRMIEFIAGLPFKLTPSQLKAYREITLDMNSPHIMNRLLEGDVGSGKTIVAVLSMFYAYLNGFQAAIMAPTSVLAMQHYKTISDLLSKGIFPELKLTYLIGDMSSSHKKEALDDIKSGKAGIIVGTHALFQEGVEFNDLGLIVTDEQHRFGVNQREAFFKKANYPHTLIMSATPIPRTLSMILYEHMDVSVLTKSPEGRIPIKNCVVGPSYRRSAYKFILGEVKKGGQVYVICPAIEADEESGAETDMENVLDYTQKLKSYFPRDIRIVSLHGRMKDDEKEKIMTDFKEGKTDILVSTTVIEVGVDVPNATVMMIENSERFGLSQLHQLRGRVGRGDRQSYCIFINTSKSKEAAERLNILVSSNDGFFIAEEDLRLRGPGDIFGTAQSGDLDFKVADIYRDADMLKVAREAVDELIRTDPLLEMPDHQLLRRKLSVYLEKGYVL